MYSVNSKASKVSAPQEVQVQLGARQRQGISD
jgi:hypothetical protein